MERVFCVLVGLFLWIIPCISGFVVRSNAPVFLLTGGASSRTSPLFGMFDMFKDAFENDATLSSDKSAGQLEGPGSDRGSAYAPTTTLTKTQQKWRNVNQRRGAPMRPESLEGTTWDLELFLAGVPSKDPSNDLYGSKTNISSRDRTSGLDIPADPSVTVRMQLLSGGVCKVSKTAFTQGGVEGQWKLSDNGEELRFSIDVIGYTRTVQTKGSITKVYWSKEEEVSRQTSTSYNIPAGWIYGDVSVEYGVRPGSILMHSGTDGGVLRVEQSMGLLGASSKMVPCGKFSARPVETINSINV